MKATPRQNDGRVPLGDGYADHGAALLPGLCCIQPGVAMALLQLRDDQGHIARLATRAASAAGLAQALLVDAFAAARQLGATRFERPPIPAPARSASTKRWARRSPSTWVNRAIDI